MTTHTDTTCNDNGTSCATISNTIVTDSGATPTIAGGGVTKDNTLGLSGTVSDAHLASVQVYDGDTLLGSATVDAGSWSFTTPALFDGDHSFTAVATDMAGNQTTSAAVTATVDTVGPPIDVIINTIVTDSGAFPTILTGGITKDNTLELSGIAVDASLASVVLYDGGTALGSATVDAAGHWSFTTAALSDGDHSFTAVATDTAGNQTTSAAVTATVDTVAPPIDTISNTIVTDSGATPTIAGGGVTKDNTLGLSGTVSDAHLASVQVYDGDTLLGSATVDAGSWSFTTPALFDGDHSFTAVATDMAGNQTTSAAVTATVDTVGPPIDVIINTIVTDSGAFPTILTGGITKDNTLELSGIAVDASLASVVLYDGGTALGSATVDAAGHWSFTTAALSDGDHSFTAVATDTAGNQTTSAAVTATVDTVAPNAPVLALGTGVSNGVTAAEATQASGVVTVTGEVNAAIAVTFTNGTDSVTKNLTGTGSPQAVKLWPSDVVGLGNGTISVSATQIDQAGNAQTAAANTTSFTLDTVPPTIAVDATIAGDNAVNAAEQASGFNITGTSSGADGQTATIAIVDGSNNVVKTYTPTIAAGSGWSVSVSAADASLLTDGSYTITADVSDAAGNPAIEATRSIVVDLTADGGAAATVTVDDLLISNAEKASVPVTVAGLDADATAVITFTDVNAHTVTKSVSANGQVFADLTGLADGKIVTTMLITDGHGNTANVAAASTGWNPVLNSSPDLVITFNQSVLYGLSQLSSFSSVTVEGGGGGLAVLTPAQFASMATNGVDFLKSSTGALTLTVAQYNALGSVALVSTDTVTIRDTGANLATLDFVNLTANNVDFLDATTAFPLTLAQYNALGTVALTPADTVTLSVAQADVDSIDFGALAGKGVDILAAADGTLTLSVAQTQALGTVKLSSDPITVADSASTLQGLSTTAIKALATKGVNALDATDGGLSLTRAQYLSLGAMTLSAAGDITLADTGAQMAALTSTQIGGLAAKGVDALEATDGSLSLTRAQYQSLGAVTLSAAGDVILADTGAQLAALTSTQIGGLAAIGVDRLDATNNALTLTAAQYQALGTVQLTAADVVTLADTGANLAGLLTSGTPPNIDILNATNNVMSLTVGQYQNLGTIALTKADTVTLADTGTALGNLSASDIAGLAAKGIDQIASATSNLTLDAAQFNALGTTVLSPDTALTLNGTTGNDTFSFFRQPFTANDRIIGGDGTDSLSLNGDFSAGLVFGADTISGMEKLGFFAGHSYNVTTNDANVGAGQRMSVLGSGLGVGDSLIFDGSAETNGTFAFTGGAGSSTFTGGTGADSVTCATGNDTLRYTAAAQSTLGTGYGSGYDTVSGFDSAKDQFALWAPATFDTTGVGGALSSGTFNNNIATAMAQIAAGHAAIFTASGGNLAGASFLLANDIGGAGNDLVVRLNNTNVASITQSNFSTIS